MYYLFKFIRATVYAFAGMCVGVALAIVAAGLLGGLATIPQVDWRHSDAVTDVVGNTIMIGLFFGVFLGSPVAAVVGLVSGLVRGLRMPTTQSTATRPPHLGHTDKVGKPVVPSDDDVGIIRESTVEGSARPKKHWLTFWTCLGVPVMGLIIGLIILWEYQRRSEQREITLRLQQIESGGADVHRDALKAIREIGPYAASPVAEALASNDSNVRLAALLASREVLGTCLDKLGEMNCVTGFIPGRGAAVSGFEQLTGALTNALGDPDKALRLEAVRVLSLVANDQGVRKELPWNRIGAVLKEALKEEGDLAARKGLIGLLGDFRPSLHVEGASALVEAMGDTDEGVRQAALQALTASLSRGNYSREKDVRDSLRAVTPQILCEATARKDVAALIELGTLGEPGVVRSLVEWVQGPDKELRGFAAAALGRLGSLTFATNFVDDDQVREELRKSIPPLMGALGDANRDVRRFAAGALSSMGTAALPAIPALERAAETEKVEYLRHAMTEACRGIKLTAEIERARKDAAPAAGGNNKK